MSVQMWQLLDFETTYEDAAAACLSNSVSAAQILTPRTTITDESRLMTPRVAVRCALSATFDHQYAYSNSAIIHDCKQVSLEIACVTRRDDATQAHGELRSKVRAAMLYGAQAFTGNTVPYYQTLDVIETSSQQGKTGENDEVVTILTYQINFAIKATSYP